MNKRICVFCASSNHVDGEYRDAAITLGESLAARRCTLVYGGGNVGLMGVLAESVHQNGGRVEGVIPQALADKGLGYEHADEMVVTPDMRARKAVMESRADAFLAMPGGFGTLEEVLEAITSKQLGFHTKAILILNTKQFFDPLLAVFEHLYASRFARQVYRDLYYVASDVPAVWDYLGRYTPPQLGEKWD
jgi:uncharacterized protein (TIGR00730 family)